MLDENRLLTDFKDAPIPDENKRSRASSWKPNILVVSIVVITLALWIQVIPALSEEIIEKATLIPIWLIAPLVYLAFYLYLYLAIAVHELGHLLFARFCGFELQTFAINRWVLTRKDRWRIRRVRKPFAGGFVASVPKSLKHASDRALMTKIAGGPIASFMMFLSGAVLLQFPAFVSRHLIVWSYVALSGVSLYMAIVNTLPFNLGYIQTDGKRLLDVYKKNKQGQRFSAFYRIDASLRQGIRPRDLDPALIESLLAIADQSSDHVVGLMVAYAKALDKGNLEQASQYLDQALNLEMSLPEVYRGLLFLEGAYFEAYVRQHPEIARQWFDKINEIALIPRSALLRAEAAVLLAEGHLDHARMKVLQGLENTKRDRFMKGDAVAEEEMLQNLLDTINYEGIESGRRF